MMSRRWRQTSGGVQPQVCTIRVRQNAMRIVPRAERRYPMTDVTPDLIFRVATGLIAAKHLFVANEVGLFVALADSPATLDDLAQRTGIPRRTLRILADAMVSFGFLERHDG